MSNVISLEYIKKVEKELKYKEMRERLEQRIKDTEFRRLREIKFKEERMLKIQKQVRRNQIFESFKEESRIDVEDIYI